MSISFQRVYDNLRRQRKIPEAPERLLCVDPGETTGWAVFHGIRLMYRGQLNTSTLEGATNELNWLLDSADPTKVVIEDYRVYANRADYHIGASLLTPRIIGGLEMLLVSRRPSPPYHKQMAGLAKGFVSDDKLKMWNMYATGQKHARDAIRHGCYFICFPPKVMFSQTIQKDKGHHVG